MSIYKYLIENLDLYKFQSFDDIKSFNRELNKWKYGVLVNGKVYTDSSKIDWSKYKTIPLKDIEKYHVGICWDFVNYQHYYFKKNKIKDESYMVVLQLSDNPDDIGTHTFSIFNYDGKKYWFESSWMSHQGIKEVNSWKDVVEEWVNCYDKTKSKSKPYSVYKYNPDGLDNNVDNGKFFDKVTRNLIYNYEGTVNESKDASTMEDGFKKKSGYTFKIIPITDKSTSKYFKDGEKERLYYINKGKKGEIAICNQTKEYAGYIMVSKNKAIGPFLIDEKYRGYGLSSILLKDAIEKYGGNKLGVYSDNEVAISLYKKFGFKVVGKKKYADGDIVLLMELD